MCSRMMIRVGAFDLMSEKKRSREKVPFFFQSFILLFHSFRPHLSGFWKLLSVVGSEIKKFQVNKIDRKYIETALCFCLN